MGGYNPDKESTFYFVDPVSKNLDKTLANYDHILILCDFNCTVSEVPMQNFCELYNLENLIKQRTCYKNPNNPSSIDVMLTNELNINSPLFIPSHYNPVTCRVDNVALSNRSFNENIDDDTSEVNHVDYACDAIGTSLQNLRKKNPNRIIISHLNINSIRNKIEMISDIIIGNIDIMLFSETKIDESFPSSQFFISGLSPPFRSDRSIYGGGLLLYVRKDIPAKLLSCSYCSKIECLPIEVNLQNKKWLWNL